jgi:molecular chaperone GrpE
VVDDLERAVAALGAAEGGDARLVEGVRMVQRKFLAQLEKHGVTTFEAEGTAFDPGQHEAVQQVNAPAAAGTVVTQLQRGFMLHERLLRPALVVVSLGPGA